MARKISYCFDLWTANTRMALTSLYLVSLLMSVTIELSLAESPDDSTGKPIADIKRRNELVDVAFQEQKDVLLDMLESKLKEVRDKKKKKADRSDFNQETGKCDSLPGNVDLKLKSKGLSAVGDAEVALKFGNSGKATLNLDTNGISNVGKARLDLGVDDGGIYIPGLSNLFVGRSVLNNCSQKEAEKDSSVIGLIASENRRSGSNVNGTVSNNVNEVDGGAKTTTEKSLNQTVADNTPTNINVSSAAADQVNVTSTAAPVTVVQNGTDTPSNTTKPSK